MRRTCAALAMLAFFASSIAMSANTPLIIEESAKLVLPNTQYSTISDVAVDGDWAVVGVARHEQQLGEILNTAYVYQRAANGTWTYQAQLPERHILGSGYLPSTKVAIEGNVIVLAEMMDSHFRILERNGSSWSLTAEVRLNDVTDVEIDGGTVFVSAEQGRGLYGGMTLRKNADGQWVSTGSVFAEPNNSGAGGPSFFSGDVAISNNLLVVAAPLHCWMDCWRAEAHVFTGGPNAWTRRNVLTLPPNRTGPFGQYVGATAGSVFVSGSGPEIYRFPNQGAYPDQPLMPVYGPRFQRGLSGNGTPVHAPGSPIAADDSILVSRGAVYWVGGPRESTLPAAYLFTSDAASLGDLADVGGRRVIVNARNVSAGTQDMAYIYDLPSNLGQEGVVPDPVSEDFETGNGGNWTQIAGSSFSVVTSGSSRVYRQSSLAGDAAAHLSNTDWEDQAIQADILPREFNGAGRWVGLVTRYTDLGNYYYAILKAPNEVKIQRMLNGSFVTLAAATLPVSVNTRYRVRLESIGSKHRLFVNGVLRAEARDTSHAHGLAGVRMYKARADYDNVVVTANPQITMFDDDFQVYDGLGWTPTGVAAWSTVNDGATNKAWFQSSAAGDARAVTGVPTTTDVSVQVRAKATSFNGAGRWFGVMVNYRDDQNYTYIVVKSDNTIALRKLEQGQLVLLDSAPLTVTLGTWYTLRLESIAGRLRAYVNGVPLVEAHNSPYASGKYGLVMYKATVVYDNFIALQP